MNWRFGASPNPAIVVVSVPGHASARFWQDGRPLESGGSPPPGSERAAFEHWTFRLPLLKPDIRFYSPLRDDWMPGMVRSMPSAADKVYEHAFSEACGEGKRSRAITDVELQQLRAWAIVTHRYQQAKDDRVIENAISSLSDTQLDWNGLEVITPHEVSPENVRKVCSVLGQLTGSREGGAK